MRPAHMLVTASGSACDLGASSAPAGATTFKVTNKGSRAVKWTGWHQIEKALWTKKSLKGEGPYADDLIKNLEILKTRVGTASITATSMANGAKELLDEVATGKVTGEEDAFSHTDLSDFKGNVDGAQKAFELPKPVVQENDATLVSTLTDEFGKVQKLLAK